MASASIPDLFEHNNSIYEFHPKVTNPKAEIIFFHDILWKHLEKPYVQSWMSTSTPPVCWPQDWLKLEYPETRILSAHYDASRSKTEAGGHMDLYKLAENLKQDILDIYKEPSYETSRPIFLVGHGVGGLIIMSLVIAMREERINLDEQDKSQKLRTNSKALQKLNWFLKNIRGVFYYATPFQGSELAETTKKHPGKGSLLASVEVFSEETCRNKGRFAKWRRHSICKAMAIFATLPTEVERKRLSQVVTEASARGDVDNFYSVSCNHFDVCRPTSRTDGRYGKLIGFINQHSLVIDNGPVALTEDKSKLLEDILSDATGISKGTAGYFAIDDLKMIRQCPEMCSRLKAGFESAGLELMSVNETDGHEIWEKAG